MDITLTESIPKVVYSDNPHTHWEPLTNHNILLLIGATGVGKTTTASHLLPRIPNGSLLPDRRSLTTQIIIEKIQKDKGLQPPQNRIERYNYSRLYRKECKQGMAKILSNVYVEPTDNPPIFLFDGLRGLEETRCAIQEFKQAKFLALHTCDSKRILRLLQRNDTFDICHSKSKYTKYPLPFLYNLGDLGLSEEVGIIGKYEAQRLLAGIDYINLDAHDLIDKIQIVAQDRKLYNPEKALQELQEFAPERSIIIDTTETIPQQVAEKVLEKWF